MLIRHAVLERIRAGEVTLQCPLRPRGEAELLAAAQVFESVVDGPMVPIDPVVRT